MKRLKQVNKLAAIVPTASMADIAFLLIVFFMLTTSSAVDKASVDLADSLIRVEVEKDAAVVSIDSQGVVRFSDGYQISQEVAGIEDLGNQIQEVQRLSPDKQFILKVDKNVKYSDFDAVYDRLRQLQVTRINLLTEQEIVK